MESTDSSSGSQPNLPPGFRFHPTDEELVVHYLKKKATSVPLPVSIIADVDLYKFDPWELPAKAAFGEQEWYFFSPRDRKYPNGARPNRAATSGYWKATGTDKPVLTLNGTKKIGVKKALVFYGGKPPKGIKTNWIMHEYRLTDHKSNSKPPGCDLFGNKNNSLRLDDWVLCRIYKKNNNHKPMDHDREDPTDIDMIGSMKVQLPKTELTSFGGVIENDHHLFDIGILSNDGLINTTTASLSPHLISSSNSKPVMSLVSDSTMSNFVPLKRSLHGLYWSEDDDQVGLSSSKRMQLDNTSSEGNNNNNYNGASNSTISLLSQIPQNPSLLQQQAILGSSADGLFRAPYELPAGINWYS